MNYPIKNGELDLVKVEKYKNYYYILLANKSRMKHRFIKLSDKKMIYDQVFQCMHDEMVLNDFFFKDNTIYPSGASMNKKGSMSYLLLNADLSANVIQSKVKVPENDDCNSVLDILIPIGGSIVGSGYIYHKESYEQTAFIHVFKDNKLVKNTVLIGRNVNIDFIRYKSGYLYLIGSEENLIGRTVYVQKMDMNLQTVWKKTVSPSYRMIRFANAPTVNEEGVFIAFTFKKIVDKNSTTSTHYPNCESLFVKDEK